MTFTLEANTTLPTITVEDYVAQLAHASKGNLKARLLVAVMLHDEATNQATRDAYRRQVLLIEAVGAYRFPGFIGEATA